MVLAAVFAAALPGAGGNGAASAQAKPSTPTPTPTPSPCKPNITVTLTESYGKNVLSGQPLCRLGLIGDRPFDTHAANTVTGDADLVFSGDSIEIDYEVTQHCLLRTYGVLYNDNVLVQLSWLMGFEPGPGESPPPPVLQCGNNDRPALRQARQGAVAVSTATPTPAPVQTAAPVQTPVPMPTPRAAPGSGYFVAAADAAGSCQTNVSGMSGDPAQCVATKKLTNVGGDQVWTGKIKLPIVELEKAGVPRTFTLMVIRDVYAGIPRDGRIPPAYTTSRISVTINPVRTVANQQYAAYAPSAGHASDVPSHRRGANLYLPLEASLLATGTVSDDSSQPLVTRDSAISALNVPSAKSFNCHSCGSFTADDKQPFQSPFTSTATLGVNLDALGVDAVPFTTSAAAYPIDAGYKLVLLPQPGTTATTAFGIATSHGLTKSNGYAHDSVLSVVQTVPGTASQLQLGLFHAVANRTVLPTPAPGAFPSTTTPLLHSANTQGSIAYSFSPQALHLFRESQTGQIGLSTVAPLTYTTLVRYGTQYGAASQVFDVVESIQKRPPALDPFSAENEQYHFSGAVGYRSVGPRYNPIDASFDQHAGERGPYASLAYTVPVDLHDGFGAGTFSLSGYGFSDGVRVRDEALLFQVSYPLSTRWTLQSKDMVGHVTVSQAGRANGLLISDALGGDAILPNGQYNLQLVYAPADSFKLTTGYTRLYSQGCNTKLKAKPQPCYPFRQPTAVADLAWLPFASESSKLLSSFFIEGSIQGTATTPFQTATDAVLATRTFNYYNTTASRVQRTAAVGTTLFSTKTSCATLLLTTANRGGDIDNFAKSAPVPGFTNTASVEFVPGEGWPSLLAAYTRVENKSGTPAPQRLFTLRAQLGVPFFNFAKSAKGTCGG